MISLKPDKHNRDYIERLRHDPRTKALFDSFVYQAIVEVRERHGCAENHHQAEELAHRTAERAVALAMAFVLDNDGEYRMVCEQRDQLLERQLKGFELSAMSPVFVKEQQG
jgi:hypothetical protein